MYKLIKISVISVGVLFACLMLVGTMSMLKTPNPHSPEIRFRRLTSIKAVHENFGYIEDRLKLKNHGASYNDSCYQGQNNWKVHDGYDNRCSLRISQFYGIGGDLREWLLNLEQKLIDDGWVSEDSMQASFNRYDGGHQESEKKFMSDNFVPYSYEKGSRSLQIAFLYRDDPEAKSEDPHSLVYSQELISTNYSRYNVEKFQDVKKVIQDISPSYEYVATISIQDTYFEN